MNKKNITLIVVLVIICAVALGAYALVRDPVTRQARETTIPVPERVSSTTIPFVLHTNPALGVSFSMPQGWETVPGKTVRVESPDFVEETVTGTEEKRVTAGAAISVSKEPFLINSSEEYAALIGELHDDPECGNCLTGHRITIAGVPAHLGFASVGTSTEPKGAIISLVSGGSLYRILMSFASYTPLNEEILAEVIGTFALTN